MATITSQLTLPKEPDLGFDDSIFNYTPAAREEISPYVGGKFNFTPVDRIQKQDMLKQFVPYKENTVPANEGISPETIAKLEQLSKAFEENARLTNDKYGSSINDSEASRKAYYDIMNRMMDREDKQGSGNPFTDMLEGFVRMKQRTNPDYQFNGIVSALGGLFGKTLNKKPQQNGSPSVAAKPFAENGSVAQIIPTQEAPIPFRFGTDPTNFNPTNFIAPGKVADTSAPIFRFGTDPTNFNPTNFMAPGRVADTSAPIFRFGNDPTNFNPIQRRR